MKRGYVHKSIGLAGRVIRYHTWPTIHQQTVGAHSWRVATLYCQLFGVPRGEVLYFILHHDSGEQYAGDIPFAVKQDVLGLKEAINLAESSGLDKLGVVLPTLEPKEWDMVKLCDILEMWEFGMMELHLGNKYCEPVVESTHQIAVQRATEIGPNVLYTVLNWIARESKRYGVS